jgi:hypothetical protein
LVVPLRWASTETASYKHLVRVAEYDRQTEQRDHLEYRLAKNKKNLKWMVKHFLSFLSSSKITEIYKVKFQVPQ